MKINKLVGSIIALMASPIVLADIVATATPPQENITLPADGGTITITRDIKNTGDADENIRYYDYFTLPDNTVLSRSGPQQRVLKAGEVLELAGQVNNDLIITAAFPAGHYYYTFATFNNTTGKTTESTFIFTKGTPTKLNKLPATGQTKSYTQVFGEDPDYLRNPMSYTDNGDGTVSDKNTGLMWKQDFVRINKVSANSGWSAETTYCQNSTLGGFNDWRLPKVQELHSLLLLDRAYAPPELLIPINESIFKYPPVGGGFVSTSTVDPKNQSNRFVVHFANGIIQSTASAYLTTCVRNENNEKLWTAENLNDSYGSEPYTHPGTRLTWQPSIAAITHTWEKSLAYCEDLNQFGYNDWRLPNIKELVSILDFDSSKGLTGNIGDFWSSSTWNQTPSYAWSATKSSGVTGMGKQHTAKTRCVRGGLN